VLLVLVVIPAVIHPTTASTVVDVGAVRCVRELKLMLAVRVSTLHPLVVTLHLVLILLLRWGNGSKLSGIRHF
jgi:hypothetical protein